MYNSDKPIISTKEDLFNRSGFAGMLAKTLINLDVDDTYTIGLFGKWGSGKTSLINMTLETIFNNQKNTNDNCPIIIRFEPWNISNDGELISQFFIHLSNVLKSKKDKTLSSIGDAIERYASAFEIAELIPYAGKIVSTIGEHSLKSLGQKLNKNHDGDILKQKEYIINLLKTQKRKILVVIDDIDRLSNDQIRQVFQLVTAVAKFPNTSYILAFDKEIVVKALEKVQEGSGEDYLEKVIQMPIYIPEIKKTRLEKVLLDKLNNIISFYDICFNEKHWNDIYSNCVRPFFNSLRDINRLCNNIEFKLASISEEVDFSDMVAISSVELFLPRVFEWIRQSKYIFTGDEASAETIAALIDQKSSEEWYKIYREKISELINTIGRDESFLDKTISCLSYLFPYFGHKIGKNYFINNNVLARKNCLISHPDKFDRYFSFYLEDYELKKADINNAINNFSKKEFNEFLFECDKRGICSDFLEEIKSVSKEISHNRKIIIISSIFETSSRLGGINNKNILSIRVSNLANEVAYNLLGLLDKNDEMEFLSQSILNANIESISTIAIIINMMEQFYGRFTKDEEHNDYYTVLSLEELKLLENEFCAKIKSFLKTNNFFDIPNWSIIYHLMENIDNDFMKLYSLNSFNTPTNILKYLDRFVEKWIGGVPFYSINSDYSKAIDKEQIIKAINDCLKNGELFNMTDEIKNKCAAFILSDATSNKNDILQTDIDKLIDSWQNNR